MNGQTRNKKKRSLHYAEAIDITILHQQVASLIDDMMIFEIDWRTTQGKLNRTRLKTGCIRRIKHFYKRTPQQNLNITKSM